MIHLKRLMFDKGLNQTELGKILGIDQSQVSLMVNGRRDIKQEHIDILIAKFGKEAIDAYTMPNNVADIFKTPRSRQIQATIIPAEIVEEIQGENVPSNAATIELPPVIPDRIAMKPNFDVLEWLEGSDAAHSSPILELAERLRRARGVFQVPNNAMAPTLCQGEYVFLEPFADGQEFTDGDIYIIDTKHRGMMVYTLWDDGDYILAKPENTIKYGELRIPKTHVIRLYNIIFHGSTHLPAAPMIDYKQLIEQKQQIKDLQERLDKERERYDNLIDRYLSSLK